jgi:hypothetical protein
MLNELAHPIEQKMRDIAWRQLNEVMHKGQGAASETKR